MSRTFGRRVKDKLFGNTEDTSKGIQTAEMADARKGVIYFLGNINTAVVFNPDLSLVGNFIADTTLLSDLKKGSVALIKKTSAGRALVSGVNKVKEWIADKLSVITDWFKDLFQKFGKKLQEWLGPAADGAEVIAEYIVWATAELTQLMTEAIPGWGYVQSAADLYKGLRQAVIATKNFISQLYSGYGVKLLGGHPSIIANALARHSLAELGSGIKDAGVAVGKIAIEAGGDALAGVGSIFSACVGAFQRVINFVDRIIQRWKLQKVLDKARDEWALHKAPGPLIGNHQKFSEWFQSACCITPVVAAFTVNCGFAANPMRFLQLLKADDSVVSQSEFDKGAKHIVKLQSLGKRYLKKYADDYRIGFDSDDKYVKARLRELILGEQVEHLEWHVNPLYTGT